MGEKLTIDLDNLRKDERAKLIEIIESATKRKNEQWKPKIGERYWALDSSGVAIASKWEDDNVDLARFAIGNCFKTEEEAGFAVECIKVVAELHRYAKEHNSPKFDRNIRGCEKWYPIYDQTINKIVFGYSKYMLNSEEMFETERIAKAAVKEIGEDRLKKYYFGVK